jgi:coenzyme F420-reducing hydrogenase beta subunit
MTGVRVSSNPEKVGARFDFFGVQPGDKEECRICPDLFANMANISCRNHDWPFDQEKTVHEAAVLPATWRK